MLYFPCGLAVGELNTCFPLRLQQISWDLCSSIPWDQLNFKSTLLMKQECKRWKTPLKWVSDSSVLGFLFQYDIWSPVNANIVTFHTNITSLIPARLQRDSWCHSQVTSVHGSIISWSDISSPSTTYMWLWRAGIGTINIFPWQSYYRLLPFQARSNKILSSHPLARTPVARQQCGKYVFFFGVLWRVRPHMTSI